MGLFSGCVAQAMFPQTNWATARVLQANGCDVITPAARPAAEPFIITTGPPLRPSSWRPPTPTPSTWPGSTRSSSTWPAADRCSKTMDTSATKRRPRSTHAGRSPYPRPRHRAAAGPRAFRFQGPRRLRIPGRARPGPPGRRNQAPRHLSRRVPSRPRPESARAAARAPVLDPRPRAGPAARVGICCGAAGSYNLTEPEMSQRLSDRKLANILACDVQAVITGNAGCSLQIQAAVRKSGRPIWVAHPMDILDLSYRQQQPPAI